MSDRPMTLGEHLAELRRRLLISVAAVLVCTAVAFVFRDPIMAFLLQPGFGNLEEPPIATEVLEAVSVIFKVTLMVGFIVALPIVLYQVIMFVSPGLTRRERFYLFMFLPGVVLSFVAGVAFGYYVLFPPAFNFLFKFGSEIVDHEIRISSYINTLTSLMFWMGVVFQIPIVMFGLGRLGVVTPKRLSSFRRFAVVIAFVAGAIITPTFDPLNQTLVAMPMILLYEVGILLARLGGRMRRPQETGPRADQMVVAGGAPQPQGGSRRALFRRIGRRAAFWKRGRS